MIIRKIRLNDAENFLELNKKMDESGFMLYEPGERTTSVDQQEKILDKILSNNKSTLLIAEENKEIVGFIAALGNQVMRKQHSASLAVGIDEEFQGRGIATQLFNKIFQWANDSCISRLELTVITDNTKAFKLYKKMGFLLEGEEVHSLITNGNPVNEYYLYKLL